LILFSSIFQQVIGESDDSLFHSAIHPPKPRPRSIFNTNSTIHPPKPRLLSIFDRNVTIHPPKPRPRSIFDRNVEPDTFPATTG
jgi:hypothetical protein